ncbi:HNH endonuclease signature motif containing protein [Arthrobacter castelli]|uniref:HNH endonuclease signature motif containing protein n=1 Tax=Arthrobacter castelli TaxID=271431 RepID=UPI001FE0A762|nr:HNH endonuclease signature motif containing protein [Arthrobacter castelli]
MLAAERRRLDAAYLEAIAVVEQLNAACLAGSATSTHAYLRAQLGMSPGRAKADVAAAQAVHGGRSKELVSTSELHTGPLASMGDLLSDGTTSMAHLDVGVNALEKIPGRLVCPENLERITGFLTDQAPVTTPREIRMLSDRLIRSLEPDRDDHYDPEAFNRRSFTMSTDVTGMVHGSYQLDPAAGAELRAIMEPLSAPKPGQKDEDGNIILRDTRTPGQRRADAFGELIRAGSTYLGPPVVHVAEPDDKAGGTGESATLFEIGKEADGKTGSRAGKLRLARRPTRVSIVTTMEQIAAMATDRTNGKPGMKPEAYGQFSPIDPTPSHCTQIGAITAGTVARMSCDGLFERVVLDAKGAALDLGQLVRLASPAQRRALAVRDGGCVVPGCDRPPGWCEVHHILWYSRGGPTDIANEGLFCPSDHSRIHAGLLEAKMIDGIPYVRLTERALAKGHSGFLAGAVRHPEQREWMRNGYFDRLKSADAAARAIVLDGDAAGLAA